MLFAPIHLPYIFVQQLIVFFFKPPPPPPSFKPTGRVAIIGAGLTGISAAAHCVAHGFDVVIFEADEKIGGIWSRVNSTSGLQLNSTLYRFHPGLLWKGGFPRRDEILSEINRLWVEYDLKSRTRFSAPVTSTRRLKNAGGMPQWEINDGKDGIFNAIIATIGTCGDPAWIPFDGIPKDFLAQKINQHQDHSRSKSTGDSSSGSDSDSSSDEDGDVFKKPILHSSQLDTLNEKTLNGKTVGIIGAGASGVEAVQTALNKGAAKCYMIARDDKWIIPRNTFIDTLIAMQPFGREMPLSFLWEKFIAFYNYRGVEDLVPIDKGLFEGTPVVNSEFLSLVRSGACTYVRGDTLRLTSSGVLVNERSRGTKPGVKGTEKEVQVDTVVLATGFKKPSVDFLPKDLFPDKYERPNLYLQTFSTEDWSVCLINCAYMDAIGSVGHFHIGVYTRVLLTFLMDPTTRPPTEDMKLWVDIVRWIKKHLGPSNTAASSAGSTGQFGFFTYSELVIWFLFFHLFRWRRLQWVFFIMQGWGVHPNA